jgi:hypothetical protein
MKLPSENRDKRFSLMKSWLESCVHDHLGCRTSVSGDVIDDFASPLPTRVLRISSNRSPYLYETTTDEKGSYAALSYCWGSNDNAAPPLMTTRENIESFRKSINLIDIPQTIQDAIAVAIALGFKYLWVDSFCIIQRDRKDWEKAAGRMAQVYQNATLTIAVLVARESAEGFLQYPLREWAVRLPFFDLDGDGKSPGNQLGEFVIRRDAIIRRHDTSPYVDQIECSRWASRAWTLQEDFLSRRTLFFGYRNAFFECQANMQFEGCRWTEFLTSPNRRSYIRKSLEAERSLVGFVHNFHPDHFLSRLADPSRRSGQVLEKLEEQFFKVTKLDKSNAVENVMQWSVPSLMHDYTRRAMTNPTDRLIAFHGMAEVIAKYTRQKYKAGIFSGRLPKNLFWRPTNFRSAESNALNLPSWSWASVDGDIQFWQYSGKARYGFDVLEFTGGMGSLKEAAFEELRKQGSVFTTLQLSASCIGVTTTSLTVTAVNPGAMKSTVYSNAEAARLRSRETMFGIQEDGILPHFWPAGYGEWDPDRTYHLCISEDTLSRSRMPKKNRPLRCPNCSSTLLSTESEILAHVVRCKEPAHNRPEAPKGGEGTIIGFAHLDAPYAGSSPSLSALILWQSSRAGRVADGMMDDPERDEDAASTQGASRFGSLSIREKLQGLDKRLWTRAMPKAGRPFLRPTRTYYLLLIEPTGDSDIHRRVGIGIAYYVANLDRFGGLQLEKHAKEQSITLV